MIGSGNGAATNEANGSTVPQGRMRVNRFRLAFNRRHVVLPVIHATDCGQALRNTRIAREAGADGVFLINHDMSCMALVEVYREVVAAFPAWWIGLNCLDLDPTEVFAAVPPATAGLWVDNGQIQEEQSSQPLADRVRAAQQTAGWQGLYFGGVAFKYQRPVSDLTRAAQIAARYMDVVTTSGVGTGYAAAAEKIRTMRAALDDHPLAIASGITPKNVYEYLPYADCFLVATGIASSFEELDATKATDLVQAVRAFRP